MIQQPTPITENSLQDSDSLETMDPMLQTIRRILRLGPICDSCLGRQLGMLSTGLTNAERGRAIKTYLGLLADTFEEPLLSSILQEVAPTWRPARIRLGVEESNSQECWVCMGLMRPERIGSLARKAADRLQYLQYSTFLVGTKMSGILAENEELLLAEGGSIYAEPLKAELNREVGKVLATLTGREADLKNPDVTVYLLLANEDVDLQVSSIYIYGRYRKLQRGFPQTRWPCRECRGDGCPRCSFTGRMYPESVDELIRDPVIEAARAEDTVFHGSGREDIDALMLGTGRPFVVEALKPTKRDIDLESLRREINRSAAGKVEVSSLVMVDHSMVEKLKSAAYEKTYSVLVRFSAPMDEEKLKSVLNELVGSVQQRTPTRVSHRRADKVRLRKVHSAELKELQGETARIIIRCDSGLYVKELVSGDGGRTVPSLSGAVGMDAVVVELDVIEVGGGSHGQVTWSSEKEQG